MAQVQIHPDGDIIVRKNGEMYYESFADFTKDFGIPVPSLPPGVISVIYDSETGQLYGSTGNTQVEVSGTLVAFAEQAIALLSAGAQARDLRQEASSPQAIARA